jgi:hypothetical protein
MTSHDAAPPEMAAPEPQIAFDMLRRGLPVAPVLIALSALVWGADGALSSAFAIALVLVNLLLSAVSLAWAAKISPTALMATALGGFLVRMTLLVIAVALVKDQSWVETVPLGITVVVTHLGLLFWETRHVSASLAFPALKPRRS